MIDTYTQACQEHGGGDGESEDKMLKETKVTGKANIKVISSTINDVLVVNMPKDTVQQRHKGQRINNLGMFST